ncbi:MAG TPA: hypothetical protein PLO89_00145 [Spirochaetota bacterium]|nr:hypothetical protein [Spirochaetota bacterium]
MKVFKSGWDILNVVLVILPVLTCVLYFFNVDLNAFFNETIKVYNWFALLIVYFLFLCLLNLFITEYKKRFPPIVFEVLTGVKVSELNKGERFLEFTTFFFNKSSESRYVICFVIDFDNGRLEYTQESVELKSKETFRLRMEKIPLGKNDNHLWLTVVFSNGMKIKRFVDFS